MTAQTVPHVSNSDRLGLTLFLALSLHSIVILGVSFDLTDLLKRDDSPLSLEITLVHSKSDQAPEQADYLAQVNQEGGGDVKEKVRPSSPFPNPNAQQERGDAPNSTPASSPRPRPQPVTRPVVTSDRSALKVSQPRDLPTPVLPEVPTADQLMQRSLEIARLSAEISEKQRIHAQRPKVKTITIRTKSFRDALYLKGWQDKVERVGNINYPPEAKRRNISGHLTVVVEIKPNGTLHHVEVARSSGHPLLDEAALRIVRMSAPFAPLPMEMRKDYDLLRIVRTWKFESNYRFSGGG